MLETRFQGEEVMVAGARQLLLFKYSEEEVVQVELLILGKEMELVTEGVQVVVDGLLCWQEEVLVILEGSRGLSRALRLAKGNAVSELDVGVKGFNCLHLELHRKTGSVFVETLLDFNTLEVFFFRCFLVSAFRVLISIF